MLNDDLNRNDLNRDNLTGVDDRRTAMGGGMIGLIAAAAVLAVLFMWAPWSGPKIADNTAPGTTVGSSTTRPAAPVAPTAPAREPAIPAAPSTTSMKSKKPLVLPAAFSHFRSATCFFS